MEKPLSTLGSQIEKEIKSYTTESVAIGADKNFSQLKLVNRITMFETKTYPSGKFDSQGNYKFWVDIISPRIMMEVKNVDFSTKDIQVYSPRKSDRLKNLIVNLKLGEYLREHGQAEEINSAVEEGAGWGNVVWKKVLGGYERVDLRNFYVINQSAQTLAETPVIERHEFNQSDLRAKEGIWKNIDEVLDYPKKAHKPEAGAREQDTTTPYYEIFERNGEVCLKDLKEEKNELPDEGDSKKYVQAKVVACGESTQGGLVKIRLILYADEIKKSPYKEFHRGAYKGRWFREGLYELLFDLQVRANQIANQLAQGLEYASKIIFRSADKLIVQNIMTDLSNGDILRSADIQQVTTTLQGFSELANEWNNVIKIANEIANSNDVIFGNRMPAGTSYRLGQLLNQNANKLYDFVREKLAIPLAEIFEEWVIPEFADYLAAQSVLRLTGDSDMLERFIGMVADDWYVKNLVALGPHTPEIADVLKKQKIEELKARPELLLSNSKEMWKDYFPKVSVNITAENSMKDARLKSLERFIGLEQDPVRRQALIEEAMDMVGIDAGSLPKSEPGQMPAVPAKRRQPARSGEVKSARKPSAVGQPV